MTATGRLHGAPAAAARAPACHLVGCCCCMLQPGLRPHAHDHPIRAHASHRDARAVRPPHGRLDARRQLLLRVDQGPIHLRARARRHARSTPASMRQRPRMRNCQRWANRYIAASLCGAYRRGSHVTLGRRRCLVPLPLRRVPAPRDGRQLPWLCACGSHLMR